jgi:hypothetical protein
VCADVTLMAGNPINGRNDLETIPHISRRLERPYMDSVHKRNVVDMTKIVGSSEQCKLSYLLCNCTLGW